MHQKLGYIKKFKYISLAIIWTLIGIYVMSVALLHVPAVQRGIASRVSDMLSESLSTRVRVGSISLGLFNRVIADDITLDDRQGRPMLSCRRASAKIAIMPLLNGRTVITSAQLFGADVRLKRAHKDAPLNCQFVLDMLSSDDTAHRAPLDLQVASLVVRNGAVRYDVGEREKEKGEGRKEKGREMVGRVFDAHHIAIEKVSAHVMLNALTDDTLSVRLKKLSFDERNSGLSVRRLSFTAEAGRGGGSLRGLMLQTEGSDISMDASVGLSNGRLTALQLFSNHSAVNMREAALFVPSLRGIDRTLFVDAELRADSLSAEVSKFNVNTSGRELDVRLAGSLRTDQHIIDALPKGRMSAWNIDISKLRADQDMTETLLSAAGLDATLGSRLEGVSYAGFVSCDDGKVTADGTAKCGLGEMKHSLSYLDGKICGQIETDGMQLGRMLSTDAVGQAAGVAEVDMTLSPDRKHIKTADVDIRLSELAALDHVYRNAQAELSAKDGAAQVKVGIAENSASGTIVLNAGNVPALTGGSSCNGVIAEDVAVVADIQHLAPAVLNITDRYGDAVFSGIATIHVDKVTKGMSALALLDGMQMDIRNFSIDSEAGRYVCDSLLLTARKHIGGRREICLRSDFASVDATGRFDVETLPQSLTNLVASQLPTLPGLPQYIQQNNDILLTASIRDMEVLRRLAGIDVLASKPIDVKAYVNDNTRQSNITIDAQQISVKGNKLENMLVNIYSPGDTLRYSAKTHKRSKDGEVMAFGISGKAAGNILLAALEWQNESEGNGFRGSLNTMSRFYRNKDGKDVAHVSISPSEVMIGDSLWHIRPANVVYASDYLKVDDFLLQHEAQHISIDGLATKNSADSLNVGLQDVNVAYILDFVNFRSVEFDGFASGDVVVKSLFSDVQASARLDVSEFRFEKGRMGTLTVFADWDNENGQVNLRAQCADDNVIPMGYFLTEQGSAHGNTMQHDGRTLIDGYISAKRNYIDLDIRAHNTRAEFMESFCSSFMDNVNVWANGRARLWGDLKKINLTGSVVANGTVFITPLNTSYTLKNDTVNFLPEDIQFAQCAIYDQHGGRGVVNGALHHKNLGRMTFDIDVEADNMLCYDFPMQNGSTFGGHVTAAGTCRMTGRPGEIVFDIEAFPKKGTEIVYNVSSPDALQNQEFITWRDKTKGIADTGAGTAENNELSEFRSDMRLNFLIHATPESTLRLIMDEKTGDYITLNGNGTLRANHYNKGAMQIFGNYNVTDGEYKMTIQQLITKSFQFIPGGTIAFGGEPFESAINLQAQYVVPSVPLSDLNIGNSFADNTVKVNCIMNITGTAEQPRVEFDLNLPQASADVQQMITSIMDSEQKRNQQVVYLLSVGRFYAADNNAMTETGQSQASLAMQSFLSGTLSQQINNVIGDVILKNRNWNFGANVSPGDEGMMNAEYEGLISGRMFNNRLQINGQFGYRDNANATTSFIGDFDVRYLLLPNGNLQVRVYNQTSDRYFSKSTLNTQGIGIVFKHDFNSLLPARRKDNDADSVSRTETATVSADSKVQSNEGK